MAKISNVKWGSAPDISLIRNDLQNILGKDLKDISITHLKNGFTDNVFLIKSHEVNIILKEFTEDWHLREIEIYKKILNKDPNLMAPKMLFNKENRMYLKYLPTNIYSQLNKEHIEALYKWLIYKHNKYSSNIISSLIESEEIKRHYLVEKPIKKIEEELNGITNLNINRELLTKVYKDQPKILKLFNTKTSLLTLEHGDLENQNLYWNKKQNEIAIIDWTNAKFSDGLGDINQFLENCEIWGIETSEYINRFNIEINIPDLEYFLKRNLLFKSLNRIHYYMTKLQDGIKISETNGYKINELTEKYLKSIVKLSSELF